MASHPIAPATEFQSVKRPRAKLAINLSPVQLSVIVTLYIAIVFNHSLIAALYSDHQAAFLPQLLFMTCSVIMVFCSILFTTALFSFRSLFKGVLVLFLITGACASYFMDHYQIVLDRDMIRNILETDPGEAEELFSFGLLAHVLISGIVPAVLVIITRLQPTSWLKNLGQRTAMMTGALALFLAAAFCQYQDFASVFRNHRELRYLLVPSGYTYALGTFISDQFKSGVEPHLQLGLDAHQGKASAVASTGRKRLLVMVVGETARAADFGLSGYQRNTTPRLQQEPVVYFSNVHSCGTSTAVSVPCLFSYYGHQDYDADKIRHTDNLLDILQRAGVSVLWLDNNSGCKGVCSRVPYEDLSKSKDPNLCNDHECFDMVLLHNLAARIDQMKDGGVIVLHQKGSHGPGYFLRTPEQFKQFTPECHSTELQQCSQTEIRNAYDNTMYYTDYVLANLIGLLQHKADQYDSAMLYVSDHGESLGENNLYLHGLPYSIAPDEQTHVPMVLWLSHHFASDLGINQECLHQVSSNAFSHDNIFDTVLDMMNVETEVRRPERSLIAPCMT